MKKLLLILIASSLNYFYLGLYYDGDLYHYRRFYDYLNGAEFNDILILQLKWLGSADIGYGALMWFMANIIRIDHDIVIAIINGIFIIKIYGFMKKNGTSPFFMMIIFSNFYLHVLLTGAERLKISLLIILIALEAKKMWFKYACLIYAPSIHTQILPNYVASVLSVIKLNQLSNIRGIRLLIYALVIITTVLISKDYVINVTLPFILAKLEYYMSPGLRLEAPIKIAIMYIVGHFAIKQKREFAVYSLILFIAALISGSDRFQINQMCVMFYFVIINKGWRKILLNILFVIFSVKTIFFIDSILKYGHGFGNIVESVAN